MKNSNKLFRQWVFFSLCLCLLLVSGCATKEAGVLDWIPEEEQSALSDRTAGIFSSEGNTTSQDNSSSTQEPISSDTEDTEDSEPVTTGDVDLPDTASSENRSDSASEEQGNESESESQKDTASESESERQSDKDTEKDSSTKEKESSSEKENDSRKDTSSQSTTEKTSSEKTSEQSTSSRTSEKESTSESSSEKTSEKDESTEQDNAALQNAVYSFLTRAGYNGFLCSSYSDVRSCDLSMVLYQLEDSSVSSETVIDAMNEAGQTVYTDVTYMSREKMDYLCKNATGYSLSSFGDGLSSYYLSSIDVYAIEHGDTNYQTPVIQSVTRVGDTVVCVYTSNDGDWFLQNGNTGSFKHTMKVTLQVEDNNSFRFVSNLPA